MDKWTEFPLIDTTPERGRVKIGLAFSRKNWDAFSRKKWDAFSRKRVDEEFQYFLMLAKPCI